MDKYLKRLNDLNDLIGHTPLVQINFRYKNRNLKVYSKLEYYNYTGSIKDRVALYMLKKAYTDNKLKENDIIVEATSGNTGISFSAIGTYLGNPVHIYMPDWLSDERKNILKSFNAALHLVSKKDGGFKKCISLTKELEQKDNNVFLPKQFSNPDNIYAHYYSTGPEIYYSLKNKGIIPSAFIAGVGTGGTVMGIGKYLKEKIPFIRVYPLEPSNSQTLSTGKSLNSHRIQGISDEFVPPILNLKNLNNVIGVDDGDSIIMAQMFSKTLGLGIGISSGANFLGAVKVLEMNNFNDNIVTVFSDDNKKYLSTDLMKTEPVKDNFISTQIELTGLNII